MKQKKGIVFYAALLSLVLNCVPERLNQDEETGEKNETKITTFILPKEVISFSDLSLLDNERQLNPEKVEELKKDLSKYSRKKPIQNLGDAIKYSLNFTARSLNFRADYFEGVRGSNYYSFPAKKVKDTDCVDYAFLFKKTLEYTLRQTHISDIDIKLIRGRNANLFGKRIDNHDWVEIIDSQTGRKFNIDPTFYDFGLGEEITSSIED